MLSLFSVFLCLYLAAPFFTKPLPDETTVYETKEVTLECEISKLAPVTWYKDSVEIPVGHDDYVIHTDGVKLSLVIPHITYDQEATYSCKLNETVTKTQLCITG